MSSIPKLHLVAPPFAGHLFPLLALGQYLQNRQAVSVTVISAQQASQSIALMGLRQLLLLPGHEDRIEAIANPPYQVKYHPINLLKQFEANLALMRDLRDQLRSLWLHEKPDLVIIDSVLPVAGLLAQKMGIPWWTSIASPCAIETRRGTPSYLGGWKPHHSPIYHWRDALGRRSIRGFKRFIAWRYARSLKALDIPKLYRANGEEVIYSPERLLALGCQSFEFERDWPAALSFIGPITQSPPFEHQPPRFSTAQRQVLVSLGTHLPWAKTRALRMIERLASAMPEVCFHFTMGRQAVHVQTLAANLVVYDYLPYDLYMSHFDAAIIHGGTGVTYSCLKAAVPILVWPHDYDQFDHAARIVHRGLGLRAKEAVPLLKVQLERLFTDRDMRSQLRMLQRDVLSYQPYKLVEGFIRDLTQASGGTKWL